MQRGLVGSEMCIRDRYMGSTKSNLNSPDFSTAYNCQNPSIRIDNHITEFCNEFATKSSFISMGDSQEIPDNIINFTSEYQVLISSEEHKQFKIPMNLSLIHI
eukprot:TRINITY_DN71096_c0_g1_i1.p3 TRINITY_DN71096_c0_g1~~TRINITY_DN71096_c0_g1_i1.p3  ORF type:complete len:103 (-),score=22.62 TRINITY_DN71096_c0_g1_i1:149-457(-)